MLFGPPLDYNGIGVKAAYSVGLAAKRGAPYAKDSVDFVLAVQDDQNDDEGNLVAWGFEAKGRVTFRTAASEEQDFLQLQRNSHIRIQDVNLYKNVSDLGERFQVLQHAFVYNFPAVVLAMSDNHGELIRSLVIDFSTELKDAFGDVLKDLKELTLDWAYPELTRQPQVVKIPEEIFKIAEQIPTINGRDTLQGTVNLWLELFKLPKPFPSFKRFIPGIYAYWNSVKGGSDTTTKLMDDCFLRPPRAHLNPESASIARLIMLLFTTAHRLYQVSTADPLCNYPSLAHYRNAASKRTTFHFSILECHAAFKNALKAIQNPPPGNVLQPINENIPRQRRNPRN